MTFSILLLLPLWLMPVPGNFYDGYATAVDVSRKTGKDLVVFFKDPSCTHCEAVWNGFLKDEASQKDLISTMMDVSDFDGGVFFEMLELKDVPSWIIFNAEGVEKERWTGTWKNDHVTVLKSEDVLSSTSLKKQVTENKPAGVKQYPDDETNSAVNTSFTYIIQAGYFSSESNAKKLIEELKGKGFNDFEIKQEMQNGKTFFRIISGSFPSEQAANSKNNILAEKGITGTVKKWMME